MAPPVPSAGRATLPGHTHGAAWGSEDDDACHAFHPGPSESLGPGSSGRMLRWACLDLPRQRPRIQRQRRHARRARGGKARGPAGRPQPQTPDPVLACQAQRLGVWGWLLTGHTDRDVRRLATGAQRQPHFATLSPCTSDIRKSRMQPGSAWRAPIFTRAESGLNPTRYAWGLRLCVELRQQSVGCALAAERLTLRDGGCRRHPSGFPSPGSVSAWGGVEVF